MPQNFCREPVDDERGCAKGFFLFHPTGWRAGHAATSAEMEALMPETVATENKTPVSVKAVLHEAFTDGAHLLLIGSLLVGAITGPKGAEAMQPFTGGLFKGLLAFFLLEMSLLW